MFITSILMILKRKENKNEIERRIVMVFVYQGAGKKQRDDADPCLKSKACQRLACDLQWCLSRNNYQQKKCMDFVQGWEDCCRKVREKVAAAAAAAATQDQQKKE